MTNTILLGKRAYDRDLARLIPSRGERRRLRERSRFSRRNRRQAFRPQPDLRSATRVPVNSLKKVQTTFAKPSVRVAGRITRKAVTKRTVQQKMRTRKGRHWLRDTGFGDSRARTTFGFGARQFGTALTRRRIDPVEEHEKQKEQTRAGWRRRIASWLGK